MRTLFLFALIVCSTTFAFAKAKPTSPGKVLVVLSGVDYIALKKDGWLPPKPTPTFIKAIPGTKDVPGHRTGFFLPELTYPLRGLLKNYKNILPETFGKEDIVFANPTGTESALDKFSDQATWFGEPSSTDEEKVADHKEARQIIADLKKLKGEGTFTTPRTLASLSKEALKKFKAVFFPGGHAPMEDLYRDAEVGRILNIFNQLGKITALICHAPVALLAALDDYSAKDVNEADLFVETFKKLVKAKKEKKPISEIASLDAKLDKLAANWPYKGYQIAVFSTAEEEFEEGKNDNNTYYLDGEVTFYVADALERAGAKVVHSTDGIFTSHVEPATEADFKLTHELTTGQNPQSHGKFVERLLTAIAQQG